MNLPYQWYQKIKKKKKIKLYSYKGNQIRKLVILTNSFIYLAFIISIKRIVHFI